ncbi:uncharacterized protein LOC135954185 [Calliphora vicina]|uniref:uncharacterized protein LOC135954185 n=1 Tax=Calliphora vicina TaxID=7373 RepID=UPI00325C2AF7
MIKPKLFVIKYLTLIFVIFLIVKPLQAAIIQNPKLSNTEDGFLELKPNGSLILRSTLNNSSNVWQEAIIFKTILNAIRLMPLQTKNTLNDLNQKIYGDGVEHKFPPFMERVIQRIQTYFSIYKYTDTSKPVREDYKPTTATTSTSSTTTSGIPNETLTLGQQNEIDVNLTSGNNNSFNRNNKTSSISVDKFKRPLKTTTTPIPTTTALTYDADADEENEFIEIKKKQNKSLNTKKS